MNKKFYPPIVILMLVLLLVGCQPAKLPPIITRVTATPLPRTATPVPAPTEVPTEAAPEPTQETGDTTSETSPTESPAEAPPEPEVEGVEVVFKYLTPFQTIEEVEPFIAKVDEFEGVLLANGDEGSITISYDPNVTDVATLMTLLDQAGKTVEEPEG